MVVTTGGQGAAAAEVEEVARAEEAVEDVDDGPPIEVTNTTLKDFIALGAEIVN